MALATAATAADVLFLQDVAAVTSQALTAKLNEAFFLVNSEMAGTDVMDVNLWMRFSTFSQNPCGNEHAPRVL